MALVISTSVGQSAGWAHQRDKKSVLPSQDDTAAMKCVRSGALSDENVNL